jgi:REP element-mobilizing transposase RayT
MAIREKKHRLPETVYKGEVSVAFTLCVKDRQNIFLSPLIVDNFINILQSLVYQSHCIIPVYCFMPDHQHLIVTGADEKANSLNQKTLPPDGKRISMTMSSEKGKI